MEKNGEIITTKMVPDENEEIKESPLPVEAIVATEPSITSDPYDGEHEAYLREEAERLEEEKDVVGIYKNIVEDKDVDDDLIALPTVPSDVLYSYVQNSSTIKEEVYNKDINVSHSVLTNLNTLAYVVEPGFFRGIKPNPDIVNEVNYKDKKIKFEEVNIRSGSKEKSALDKIRSVTRIGKNIQAPLWNTGIRVTILVPPVNEIYELKKKLRDLNIESDIETGGLLFSNKKIKLYTEITTFISSYIMDTTLAVPEDKTLFDFVNVVDIALLIVGTSLSFYPNGNYVTVACTNTTKIINQVPKCNFVANSKVDTKELVKIDNSRITDTMLEIINRRNSGSVTVADLETYRKEFINNNDFFKIIVPYETSDLVFNLAIPDINTFIRRGNVWYDDLVAKLYNVGQMNLETKKNEIDKIIELSVLGVYNSYVISVEIEGELFTDEETIDSLLNEVSQDNYLYNIYLKHIMNFISYITIANIGTNNYLCPLCKTKQKQEEEDGIKKSAFEMEYIWMDPIAYFLEIMNSKLTKMQKRVIN